MTAISDIKCKAFAVTLLCASSPALAEVSPQIAVTGTGEIMAVPDMATVSLGVSHDAITASDALSGMSVAMERILARVIAAGIDEADFQTGTLRLNQRFEPMDNGRRVPSGYTAFSNLNVRVLALDTLGEVLSAVVTDGANQMHGLSFDIADRSELLIQARQAAVADARAKAEVYANAAGVELGEVISIAESGASGLPQSVRMEGGFASARADVPVAAGELAVTAQINITWALE